MKKLLFSAMGIVAVVGSSLALKPALSQVTIYCSTPTPRTTPGSATANCSIPVVTLLTVTDNGNPLPNAFAHCSANQTDEPCTLVQLYISE